MAVSRLIHTFLLFSSVALGTKNTPPFLRGAITSSHTAQVNDDDDPRFSMELTMSETKLPPTAVLMNSVELAARYCGMDYLGRVPQRHGIVLPQFPQIEIAVIPAPPASSVEVRLVLYTIYATILDMVYGNQFNESEAEVRWENRVKAHVYFTRPMDDRPGGASDRSMDLIIPASGNTTALPAMANNTNQPLDAVFDWAPLYKPGGVILYPNDVFILALGALKVIAPYSVTEKVGGPFHVGSEIVDANLQVWLQNRRMPRPSPPFLRYGHILEAVRRIPGWQLHRHRFAEFFCTIDVGRRAVGVVLLESGPFVPQLTRGGGNASTS
ncbi:MAG: hypothetical protein L6R40_007738 [Gallowayella cf. fulva]|nr:MAG: hypothetical protein L6R40_007738 [Xanthomendoza cf. fulva]